MPTYKNMSKRKMCKIEAEIKMLLHAHRDCLRNKDVDTTSLTFDVMDGYYGEAFGIIRCLVSLGYGYFGSNNLSAVQENRSDKPYHNLRWWFGEIEEAVLYEEGFGGDNKCNHCLRKYGKDGAGRRR